MSLRIVDSLLFEISRVVETVFDELEYRSARASLKAAQKQRVTKQNDEVRASSHLVASSIQAPAEAGATNS